MAYTKRRNGNTGQHGEAELLTRIKETLGSPPDLVCHSVCPEKSAEPVLCLYLETMVNRSTIDEYILTALRKSEFSEREPSGAGESAFVQELPADLGAEELVRRAADAMVKGYCVLIDPSGGVRLVRITAPKQRQVDTPVAEANIRGPNEGFSESIATNIGLVRKRIGTPQLRFESMQIGRLTRTTVVMAYIEGVAPDELVREMRRRLKAIRTDSVLESAYIEEFIQDSAVSPFPTLLSTQRPDVVAAHLLDGKAAVLVDGTGDALVAPVTFFELFNSPEDYYQRADIATLIRWVRLLSFFIAVFVPSLYVAATTFHQEMIPGTLLLSLSAQREGVPLPAFGEVLLMEFVFEIIREAGIRMPRVAGQALSIIGAIVLGQAAVDAGLITAAIVIVVSVTGIANFVVPAYSFGIAQRLLRFTFIILAGFMGLFGILCGTLLLIAHLASLKSFGVPYLSPMAPSYPADWRDVLVRVPRPQMGARAPRFVRNLKKKRR